MHILWEISKSYGDCGFGSNPYIIINANLYSSSGIYANGIVEHNPPNVCAYLYTPFPTTRVSYVLFRSWENVKVNNTSCLEWAPMICACYILDIGALLCPFQPQNVQACIWSNRVHATKNQSWNKHEKKMDQ